MSQPHAVNILGRVIGSGAASVALRQQYAIPNTVLQAANHAGIWDVTALLPYIKFGASPVY